MKKGGTSAIVLICLFTALHAYNAFGWYDRTHIAAAKAAGYYKWYLASGADMAKIKAGSIEKYNHFFNNPLNVEVTPEMVLKQTAGYNRPHRSSGHLYGAIVASLREYREMRSEGKYAEYHLAYGAHYITDLSQPLHNIPYDSYNKAHHSENDGIVDKEILDNLDRIKKHTYTIRLRRAHFEQDLAREVARIADLSRRLGLRLKKENRILTKEEAYIQLGHSVSLLKAVLAHTGRYGRE